MKSKIPGFAVAGLAVGLLLPALNAAAQSVVTVVPLELERPNLLAYPAPDGRYFLHNHHPDDPFVNLIDSLGEEDTVEIALPLEEGEPLALPRIGPNYRRPIAWSPDGTKFVLAGTDLLYAAEADLWIYDLEAATWTNMTDDGYGKDTLMDAVRDRMEDGSPPVIIESAPAWSPDGRSIAFERYQLGPGVAEGATISILDVASGEIHELAVVPKSPEAGRNLGAVYSLDWSPDGASLYFGLIESVSEERAVDGIYRVDAVTGDIEQLLTLEAMDAAFAAVPDVALNEGLSLLPGPLQVSPDGSKLLLWRGIPGIRFIYWPFVLDLAADTETLTPVLPLVEDSVNDQTYVPSSVAWSPDSASILVLTGFLEEPIDAPELIAPADEDDDISLLALYDLASGELEPLGLLPDTSFGGLPTGQSIGLWSADGQVLLGGYYLQVE